MKLIPGSGEVVAGGDGRRRRALHRARRSCATSPADAPVMADEIFGPILPVLRVKDIEAGDRLRQRAAQAAGACISFRATRWFRKACSSVRPRAASRSITRLLHLAVPSLPFGGVGASGMGAYHGRATFETFSHSKSVLVKPTWLDPSFFYPPYTSFKKKCASLAVVALVKSARHDLDIETELFAMLALPARPDGPRRMGQRGVFSGLGPITRPRSRRAAPTARST